MTETMKSRFKNLRALSVPEMIREPDSWGYHCYLQSHPVLRLMRDSQRQADMMLEMRESILAERGAENGEKHFV